jgi:hypothetical protein
VSPFLDMPSLVIKDKNEEGGMGIFFYKNALHGGDWVRTLQKNVFCVGIFVSYLPLKPSLTCLQIIQERLYNDDFIRSLLPETAPLSTMRIITASRYTLEESKGEGKPGEGCIKALSCVFRYVCYSECVATWLQAPHLPPSTAGRAWLGQLLTIHPFFLMWMQRRALSRPVLLIRTGISWAWTKFAARLGYLRMILLTIPIIISR